MGKINIGRWILAGLVAGVVSDLLGFVVDGVLLALQWAAGMQHLGLGEFSSSMVIWFNLLGIIGGVLAMWVYAGIRPRYGAGPKTAALAGVIVWAIGTLLPNLSFMTIAGLFPNHLTLYTTLGALVEVVAGTVAGAALYKEA